MSATLWRGQAIRRRADLQRTTVEHDAGMAATALHAALWVLRWTAWSVVMGLWATAYVPLLGDLLVLLVVAGLLLGSWAVAATAVLKVEEQPNEMSHRL